MLTAGSDCRRSTCGQGAARDHGGVNRLSPNARIFKAAFGRPFFADAPAKAIERI
jgi:hypothetical protein